MGPPTVEHIDKVKKGVIVTGVLAFLLAVGALVFNAVTNNFIAMYVVPGVFIMLIAINMSIAAKPVEYLQEFVRLKGSSCFVMSFIAGIVACIAHFVCMIISINSVFFHGTVNMGVIPLTFFSTVLMIIHSCMVAGLAGAIKRL